MHCSMLGNQVGRFVAPHESLNILYSVFSFVVFIDMHVSVISNYPSKFNGVNSIKKVPQFNAGHFKTLHLQQDHFYKMIMSLVLTQWSKKCFSSGKKFLDMPCICELLHLESLWSLSMRFVLVKATVTVLKQIEGWETNTGVHLFLHFLVALIKFTQQPSHWAFPTLWDLTYLQKLHCNCEYVWLGWVCALRWFHKS